MQAFPRTLCLNGRWLNGSGSGRAPGAHVYLDPSTGNIVEVYRAVIVGTGPHFALGQVDGNTALSKVRIDHAHVGRQLMVGESVLIGPITFQPTGPVAENGWPAPAAPYHTAPRPRPMPQPIQRPISDFVVGVISSVHVTGAYGWIDSLSDARRYFVHRSAVQFGRLQAGLRVVFQPTTSPKGDNAVNVRLA